MNYYEYIQSIADDIMKEREHWSDEDIYDIAHEHADSSQIVIYYSQAHDFLQWLDQRDVAYYEGEVLAGGSQYGYNELASLIAYYALSDKISAEVLKRIEESEAA